MYYKLISLSFSVYIITLVITGSELFNGARIWIQKKTPWLALGTKHPITCRLCTGFWVALFICFLYDSLLDTLIVYGVSYFIATQERNK